MGGWLALALVGAGLGGGISFFRDGTDATAPVAEAARSARPVAASASVAPAALAPTPRERPRAGQQGDDKLPPRATPGAGVAVDPRVPSDGAAVLTLPVAAVPPDPAWRLDPDRLAEYERLGRDFLSATASSPESAEQLRRQWAEARSASDAQFEQLFGTELRDAQQHRAAIEPAAGGH